MNKKEIYTIPHACYLCELEYYEGDDGYCLRGVKPDESDRKFNSIDLIQGSRCIELIERVRDHWVVDTWLTSGEHATDKQTKLRTHKYLKQLLRGAKLWSEK